MPYIGGYITSKHYPTSKFCEYCGVLVTACTTQGQRYIFIDAKWPHAQDCPGQDGPPPTCPRCFAKTWLRRGVVAHASWCSGKEEEAG